MSDEKQYSAAFTKRYQSRITIAKNAKESLAAKDYTKAASLYREYLDIISTIYEQEMYTIQPKHIDDKTQVTELLLISHVYWDLCKVYEKTPKLQDGFQKCLNQFIIFTIDQPYQVLNSEMLRKHIVRGKRSGSTYIPMLEKAYSRIHVESKKCYVATHCFGDNHQTTDDLRNFKSIIAHNSFGLKFISFYYFFSSKLVKACSRSKLTSLLSLFVLKPIIMFIHFFLKRVIKCI